MSWDSYIDNLMGQCVQQADKACIIGQDGSKWTTDGHAAALKITAAEAATIGNAFKNKDWNSFQANGIFIEGTKYQFLREDENKIVFGKKKDHGAITLQGSKSAIVIAHTKEGSQQGTTNKGVAVIAEYLESLGM